MITKTILDNILNEKKKILAIIILLIIISFPALVFCARSSEKENNETKADGKENVFESLVTELINRKVDSAFIDKYITKNNVKFSENYVKINVTGYLKKTNYSYVSQPKSIEKSQEFLTENMSVLVAAEKQYNVPKEVIVSILWIETKLGTYLGKNHLPSVFFSTALVNKPQYMQLNSIVIDEIDRSDSEKIELKNKLKARSDKKTNWAINEIIAMCEIEKKFNIDFNNVNGSWAGAFGIPQFLPSSYLRYAVDGNNDNKIDLFNMEDAIFSVANYLNKKNWGTTVEQQKNAVWSYNNSWDYVDAVLNLSQLIKGNSKK